MPQWNKEIPGMAMNFRKRSKFRSNSAGTHDAPIGNSFDNGEQSSSDKNQPNPPKDIAPDDYSCNQEKRSDHAAGHTPRTVKIWTEKSAHNTDFA
jgi:hypothetical protein